MGLNPGSQSPSFQLNRTMVIWFSSYDLCMYSAKVGVEESGFSFQILVFLHWNEGQKPDLIILCERIKRCWGHCDVGGKLQPWWTASLTFINLS